MAFAYIADDWEADLARLAFGPTVTDVVFYDPDFPEDGEPWLAIGYEGDRELRQWTSDVGEELPGDDGMDIFDVVGERGETVKFWLTIPAAADER